MPDLAADGIGCLGDLATGVLASSSYVCRDGRPGKRSLGVGLALSLLLVHGVCLMLVLPFARGDFRDCGLAGVLADGVCGLETLSGARAMLRRLRKGVKRSSELSFDKLTKGFAIRGMLAPFEVWGLALFFAGVWYRIAGSDLRRDVNVGIA
jgi:hypothetical protein